jgi:hypothetical protein
VLSNCTKKDKEWLLSELLQDLNVASIASVCSKQKISRNFLKGQESCAESEFQESLQKLSNAYLIIPSEECAIITNIAKKY